MMGLYSGPGTKRQPGRGRVSTSIFERNGGFAAIRKIVSAFYDKVLDHPGLQRYFADIEMRRLVDHQTQFIASITGGPATVSDDVLRRVHAPLGISRAEYAELAGLLKETLEDFDFAADDVAHVHREVMRRESLIVVRYD